MREGSLEAPTRHPLDWQDKSFYDEMKQYWSEAQIMELGAFIALHYSMQMFMRSLGAVSPV